MAKHWRPLVPPGHCRHCALGEKTCTQLRNRAELGEFPRPPWSDRASGVGVPSRGEPPRDSLGSAASAPSAGAAPTPLTELSHRCYS